MQENEYEIMVLKPTRLFRLFLTVLRPDIQWPSLGFFQKDNTAYTLVKCSSNAALIDQIEYHFPDMLRHEVMRWVGEDMCDAIKGSFLDFLCFFKFELHSDVILMEQSLQAGKQMLCIKPRSILFKRTHESLERNVDLKRAIKRINYSHPAEHTTVIIKNFEEKKQIKPFVKQFYRPIVNAEMRRVCLDKTEWPDVTTFAGFNRYFVCDVHTQLIHL